MSGPEDGRYSPNLTKWLKRNERGLRGRPRVFIDPDQVLWIGWLDEDGWFSGTRLMRVLCEGAKATVYAHAALPAGIEIPDFWQRYDEIGRCAIDVAHSRAFIGDEDRRQVSQDGSRRDCQWCRAHSQVLRRWTETVERSRWEPALEAAPTA